MSFEGIGFEAHDDLACCSNCRRSGTTVYTLNGVSFGCAACLGKFFEKLDPTRRPWRMTFWDDMKSLFRWRSQ
jgi:hypothetical protein